MLIFFPVHLRTIQSEALATFEVRDLARKEGNRDETRLSGCIRVSKRKMWCINYVNGTKYFVSTDWRAHRRLKPSPTSEMKRTGHLSLTNFVKLRLFSIFRISSLTPFNNLGHDD